VQTVETLSQVGGDRAEEHTGSRISPAAPLTSLPHGCASNGVPERVVMAWVGHADSEMVRHYFHLHDEEAHRHMSRLHLLMGTVGGANGDVRSS
jgi:hypothetical protein